MKLANFFFNNTDILAVKTSMQGIKAFLDVFAVFH